MGLESIASLDLASPAGVRAALAAAGLRLRRSRGQHFLVSRRALEAMLRAAGLTPADVVLEIGAGIGTLTVELARTGAAVIAVEVDARFIPVLRASCAAYPRVRLVHADAMTLEPAALRPRPTAVVANLPYAIASPLLIRLLEAHTARRYVVMVQDEVARRLVAAPGTPAYGLLTVAVGAHASAAVVARVPRAAFFPPPEVTSAVVRLDVPAVPPVPPELVGPLMAVARAAFGQRRKMLRSALRQLGPRAATGDDAEALCRAAGIDPRERGERLSLAAFARLAAALRDREAAAHP
ncbi:MAG: 16S rRNA (adenine(1518)-N(6)/adenine(1519)-N(6))-dimethyltransferase RsmA [Armatimonadota bacterium]|nr:16S rRNA (adenine(1518)-N(6)/adenine(1519)-N(6))-dimethyltransferase RsmA [Armatimonadota bacterium]